MSREHWDRVAPVFCVFLTHWDCIDFTKFDVSVATLSVYPHRASLKNVPGHGGIRTYDL